MATETDGNRPLRADAARNRAKIMSAAAEVFSVRGLNVTLDDIASHAGVGVGTTYRRFRNRDVLVAAVFDERLRQVTDRLRLALEDPDAWTGMVRFLLQTCAEFADDRGMRQALLSGAYADELAVHCRTDLHDLSAELVERARDQGSLRPDAAATDIPMVLILVSSVADFAGPGAPELWRRYLQVLLDGMRSPQPAPAEPLAAALSQEGFLAASRAWQTASRRPAEPGPTGPTGPTAAGAGPTAV